MKVFMVERKDGTGTGYTVFDYEMDYYHVIDVEGNITRLEGVSFRKRYKFSNWV